MGVAGAGGSIYAPALEGQRVYLYADADESGRAALRRWAVAAREAGAAAVLTLEPWREDACDLAGRAGRAALAARLP